MSDSFHEIRITRCLPSERWEARHKNSRSGRSKVHRKPMRVPSPALRLAGKRGEPAYLGGRYFLGGLVENDPLDGIADVPPVKHVGDVRPRTAMQTWPTRRSPSSIKR